MNERNNECENVIAGGKQDLGEKEQAVVVIPEQAVSFGKFASAQELLNAYNSLQAEFTKRSQQLRQLEREISERNEQTEQQSGEPVLTEASANVVQDETGSAAVGLADESEASTLTEYEEGQLADEVAVFLSANPEAVIYAEEIAEKSSQSGYLGSGFLQNAYLAVLKDKLRAEKEKINDEFILEKAQAIPFVKQKIIRDYLNEVSLNKGARLIAGGGESVILPPSRPKDISQAGEMAFKILKKK